jgi:hypothetical protein
MQTETTKDNKVALLVEEAVADLRSLEGLSAQGSYLVEDVIENIAAIKHRRPPILAVPERTNPSAERAIGYPTWGFGPYRGFQSLQQAESSALRRHESAQRTYKLTLETLPEIAELAASVAKQHTSDGPTPHVVREAWRLFRLVNNISRASFGPWLGKWEATARAPFSFGGVCCKCERYRKLSFPALECWDCA